MVFIHELYLIQQSYYNYTLKLFFLYGVIATLDLPLNGDVLHCLFVQ